MASISVMTYEMTNDSNIRKEQRRRALRWRGAKQHKPGAKWLAMTSISMAQRGVVIVINQQAA